MKRLLLAATAFALSVAALTAAEVQPAPPNDLTVHEWGTFTSVAGQDGSAIEWDALGGKDDLPGFVNDYGYRCFKSGISGTVRMETPVLYFYSPQELEAHVKVSFPKGLITEWYPQAKYEVFQKNGSDGATRRLEPNLNGLDNSLKSLTGAIEWPNIQVQPNTSYALPTEPAPSRYYAARGTDSAPLTVGDEHEKFLFYRGVGRFPIPLSARVTGIGSIAVENRGAEPVPTLILFENQEGHLGYRNAGALKEAVTLDAPSLDGSLPALREELEKALVAQGLFEKEAQAMVETWRDSWFEEGTRLIYIVPSRAVDAFLPLHVDPAPSQIARVFVGRIELITPEITRVVEEAMATGNWPAIERYGRFLDPILNRIAADNPSMKNLAEQVRQKIQISTSGACRAASTAI
jgi:hypothetical protein